MALDLMKLINDAIPPGAVKTAASHLDETPERTASAISTSIPALLTTLSEATETDEGAAQLKASMTWMTDKHPAITHDIGAYLGCGEGQVAKEGAAMLDQHLGTSSARITSSLAQVTGVHARSARSLMSTLFPLMLGVIHEHTGSMSSSELRSLLRAGRGGWRERLPTPLAALFGTPPTLGASATETPLPSTREVETPSPQTRPEPVSERTRPPARASRAGWAPWVLVVFVGLLAALGLPMLGRQGVAVGVEAPNAAPLALIAVPLPGGMILSLPAESPAAGLARYLGDPNDHEPRTFTFIELRPVPGSPPGSTKLTPEATATVDTVGVILRAYPTARVRVDSNTDAAGDPATNRRTSMARSIATKQMLMARGVAGSRIDPVGSGADHPIAPNDTEENRARNRRTEIVVIKK